jgi:hypothetical protein
MLENKYMGVQLSKYNQTEYSAIKKIRQTDMKYYWA